MYLLPTLPFKSVLGLLSCLDYTLLKAEYYMLLAFLLSLVETEP